MEDKLLTISIAAYNSACTIERTLSSIVNAEKYMPLLDVIVVNDGSTDDTERIARAFAERCPDSIRVISKANAGYGSTVNTAVDAAKGRYFKLLDSDDSFDEAGFAALMECLRSSEADMILTPYITEQETEEGSLREVVSAVRTDTESELLTADQAQDLFADGLSMFEICIRTGALRSAGVRLTENCFYTDNEYAMTSGLYPGSVTLLPRPVYRYRLGNPGQSMSVEGRRLHYEDKKRAAAGVLNIYRAYQKKLADEGSSVSESVQRFAGNMMSMMIREVYVAAMLQEDPAAMRGDLEEFDRSMKAAWPEAEKISGRSRLVRTVRNSGDAAYRLLCRMVTARERRRTGTAGPPAWYLAAEYTAALCMIIQCRTVYMHLYRYGMMVNRGCWLVLVCALGICILFGRDGCRIHEINRKSLLSAAGFCVYAAVFIAVNPVNYLRVIRCASVVIMMILLARSEGGGRKLRDIAECFRRLMVVLAGISLVLWVLVTICKLPYTGYVYSDWTKTGGYVRIPEFLYIYFETQPLEWAVVSARNSGIFTEAPMAGFCCCIALLIGKYFTGCDSPGSGGTARVMNNTKGSRSMFSMSTVILSAAILSTLSVISCSFLLLILAADLADRSKQRVRLSKTARAAAIVLLAALAVPVVMLAVIKLTAGSGSTRVNDFAVGFHAWLNSPLFGGGFESLEYLRKFMPAWRFDADTGFSNSPMQILAQGGLYLSAAYIYGFAVPLIDSLRRRDTGMLTALLLFAYLFTFTAVPYQYICFFILVIFVEKSHR